jgi:predicted SprT family Zn-dependent metalloprotease
MASTRKQREAMKMANFDLFFTSGDTAVDGRPNETRMLPDQGGLYEMFMAINHKYFGGTLPRVSIEWSKRMRVAGKYFVDERLIKLGRKYHEYYPDEVEDTLKHEMVHILYPDHGPQFKREAARIGTSNHARDYPGGTSPHKYIYICPACGQKYYRHRRLRMASCGTCSKHGYDSRFKLKLHRSVSKNGGKS